MAPAISQETYVRRRADLMRRMEGGVAIIPTAPPAVHSNDVEHRYRPDSDFYYLTGFREPEAVAVIAPEHDKAQYLLFVRPRDPERELWLGARAGVEGATEVYGADAAFPVDRLESELGQLLRATDRVYFALGRHQGRTDQVLEVVRRAQSERPRTGSGPVALLDPSELLHEMRLHKGPEEIVLMREAARISCIAHRAAMAGTRAGQFEYEVEALVDSTFRRHGATGPAYPTIAAAGANATILHYQDNDQKLNGAEMMLLDAGAEVGCYAADVTRTYPIGPTFSALHRDVYAVVLEAQEAAINAAQPGAAYDLPHQRAVRVLCEGLVSLGLLAGDIDDLIEREEYRRYFMHRTSHWIGMDVHDVGAYRHDGATRVLEPGMVLTVEPGLYVAANAKEAPERFRGIGIRIEDDVLITEDGHDVLSADAPKDVASIEALRAEP